jgi:carboxylesterase
MLSAKDPIVLPGGPHAVLIVHGLAGSPLEVRYVGKLLHRAGFSVHVPNIEGYSMGSEGAAWQRWLGRLDEIYGALRPRYKTLNLAGLSSGATLALALAAKRNDVDALALWATTLRYDGWAIPWYHWLFEPCYRLGIGLHYGYRERPPFGLKNEKWRARVAHAMQSHDASAAGPALIPARFLHESMRLGRHVERSLAKVRCDTLIVHAADDETASPRNAEAVHRRIGAAHKRKIMLGDSYHIVTMDNERELVARETIRFFQQSIMWRHPGEAFQLVSSAKALLRVQRRRAAEKTLARRAR